MTFAYYGYAILTVTSKCTDERNSNFTFVCLYLYINWLPNQQMNVQTTAFEAGFRSTRAYRRIKLLDFFHCFLVLQVVVSGSTKFICFILTLKTLWKNWKLCLEKKYNINITYKLIRNILAAYLFSNYIFYFDIFSNWYKRQTLMIKVKIIEKRTYLTELWNHSLIPV